jgi:hypothetical protein
MRRPTKPWNDNDMSRLRRYCSERMPLEEIRQRLSRSEKSLREKARRMGLSLSPQQRRVH